MSNKYKIERNNVQYNDWDVIEEQIVNLDNKIDDAVLGNTSFENISGEPEDNVKLKEALDNKANVGDSYTKTEVDTLLNNKSNVGDSYTKSEEDALLADKADQSDLDSLNDEVTQIESTLTDVQEELADKVDKAEGYELMPEGLDEQVNTNKTDIDTLKLKVEDIQIIQMRIMPQASTDYLGKIVQYIGPTVEAYINGYFYQCDYDTDLADYVWIQKSTQPEGEVDLSNYYTKTETNNLLQNKQDSLTAGDGIKIVGNTIMQDILDDTISSAKTTWSSRYLESLFHSLSGLSAIEIVDERPAVPVNNTMYYVKAYEEGEEPLYEIWFYQNNTWTNFGTTAIDLTNYYTKSEVDALLAQKQATLTEGTGIRISNNNVEVKIDGTTIKVNSAGNLYVEDGGGKTYYDGQGIQVDNTNNVINANVDDTTIDVNNQSKLEVKEVPSNKVKVDNLLGTMLDTKLSDIDTELDDRYTKTEVDTMYSDMDNLKQDKITDTNQSADPTDSDSLSDLSGTTNKRWTFTRIFNWIKSKLVGAISTVLTDNLTESRAVITNSSGKLTVAAGITAQTTQAIYPVKLSATGLVSEVGTGQTVSDTYNSTANNQILSRKGAYNMYNDITLVKDKGWTNITSDGVIKYCCKNRVVTITIVGNITVASNQLLTTIPSGYRPTSEIPFSYRINYGGGTTTYGGWIQPDGQMKCHDTGTRPQARATILYTI